MLSTVLNQSSLPWHRAQHRCRQGLYLSRRKILRVRKWGWGGKQGNLSACAMGALEKRRMGRKRMLRKEGEPAGSIQRSLLGWAAADAPPVPSLSFHLDAVTPVLFVFSHFSSAYPAGFCTFGICKIARQPCLGRHCVM